MKAALYARFSSDQQRESSIEDQIRVCSRVADANGFDTVARFSDAGITGGTTERPGYQGLLTAARSGVFEVIVTEDISRLWRNRAEFGSRSAELEDLDIHLVTAVGDDTRRDGWGLVLAIKSALAEHARKEISYRTRRALEGLALAGKSTGGRTYGYGPGEAEVVQGIFRLYAVDGMTSAGIAHNLNARGIPALRGGPWQPSSVIAILANHRYTGAVEWGKSRVRSLAADSRLKRRVLAPVGDVVARQDESLRLIPDALWAAAAAQRAKRACAPVGAVAESTNG